MSKSYKYNFSVIVPVYNAGDYLEETIESVINQTIGFKDNIELILVNDGSSDNSEDICIKYANEYPENVRYIKQENGGVSKARNNGLKNANGKYINFLDSDDKWDLDVFKKAYDMFENNEDVNVISTRIRFFEASNKYHNLDYKFGEDKVVDLNENYTYIHISSCAGFIRASSIKNVKFDTKLKYAEDIKFITEILFNSNLKLGIISSSNYYYRRRFTDNSAIQKKDNDLSWYFDTPKYCYEYLINLSKQKYGYVHKYIQYLIMHDYQWRLKDYNELSLNEKDYKEYVKISKNIIKNIDDEIILEQRNLHREYKLQTLSFKYGYNIISKLKLVNNQIYYNDNLIYNDILNSKVLIIENIDVIDNKIEIGGKINFPITKYKLYLVGNDKIELKLNNSTDMNCLIKEYSIDKSFSINLPINEKDIYFLLEYKDRDMILPIYFTSTTLLQGDKHLYLLRGNKKIKYDNNHIIIESSKLNVVDVFSAYLYIIKKEKINGIKICIIRFLSYIYSLFVKREIWLVSEKIDKGKYTSDNIKKVCYYTNNDNKGVYVKSLKYKMLFLNAKRIIGSYVYNPFGKMSKYYNGILKYAFQEEK